MSRVTKAGLDRKTLKAISNPTRLDVLWIFSEREASASEVSKQLKLPLGTVCHHVDVLRDLGKIELVREERGGARRGGTELFYRACDKAHVSNEIAAVLPLATRSEISGTIFKQILRLAGEAFEAETFDSRSDRHIAWVPFELDEEGWREMVDLEAKHLEDQLEVRARAAERLLAAGESGLKAVAIDGFFEVPPDAIS